MTSDFPVDLVYLWSSGSEKRFALRAQYKTDETPQFTKARMRNNGELKYALRSVERNLPWVRNIFFVIDDNEYPDWLDIKNPRVKLVNTSEIIDKKYMPVFNSNAIEQNIYKIPGLSEKFLMSCDDMFVLQPLPKDYFFNRLGLPIYRTKKYIAAMGRAYSRHIVWVNNIMFYLI
ncbi:MAG: hypothetical protein LBL46_05135 [Rickettsiales bacterium]|jgi:hypothetical protein|nr:hypothetical protein [Rickettsiales bacterium]